MVSVNYSVKDAVFGGEKIVLQANFYTMAFRKITAVYLIIFWNMKLHGWGNKHQIFGGTFYLSFQSGRYVDAENSKES